MNRKELFQQIRAKKSMLCVGLDVDFNKMPEHVKALACKGELAIKGELYKGKARSIIEFNKAIVDATAEHCVAYKPNLAFYECYGIDGLRALDATVDYIRMKYPEIFLIVHCVFLILIVQDYQFFCLYKKYQIYFLNR